MRPCHGTFCGKILTWRECRTSVFRQRSLRTRSGLGNDWYSGLQLLVNVFLTLSCCSFMQKRNYKTWKLRKEDARLRHYIATSVSWKLRLRFEPKRVRPAAEHLLTTHTHTAKWLLGCSKPCNFTDGKLQNVHNGSNIQLSVHSGQNTHVDLPSRAIKARHRSQRGNQRNHA